MKKIFIVLAAALLAALCLSGCEDTSAEELYALPALSDAYLQLQSEINKLLDSGAEYSAPTSGSNRQAVQLEDIDGDGVRDAIAFLAFPGQKAPQKIIIFRNRDGVYSEAARIEGDGTGIDSISYVDLDGSGAKSIAVGWKLVGGMNMMSVYAIKDFRTTQILSTDYTRYTVCDLNDDGGTDLVVVRLSAADLSGEVSFYYLQDDGDMRESTVSLSGGIRTLARIRTGPLADGRTSVLIESNVSASGVVTDVLALKNGEFSNITLDPVTGANVTSRTMQVWCRDINGDGVLDIPRIVQLPALPGSGSYYLTYWYDYDSGGKTVNVAVTFTNNTDSWYITLPDKWLGSIAVRRQDAVAGERGVIFSYVGEGTDKAQDFLVIYTLTGDNREERATSADRFLLAREENRVYAAAILDGGGALWVTESVVRRCFSVLYAEWIIGDV